MRVAADPQVGARRLLEGPAAGGDAGRFAVDVKRGPLALFEDAGHVRPLPQGEPPRARQAQPLPARGDVEAQLPAVAHAEEEAGRLAVLLQQRGVVERVRAERDPAFDRERPGERRHVRGEHEHVRGDPVELQGLAGHAGDEPAVALDPAVDGLEAEVEARHGSVGRERGRLGERDDGGDQESVPRASPSWRSRPKNRAPGVGVESHGPEASREGHGLNRAG